MEKDLWETNITAVPDQGPCQTSSSCVGTAVSGAPVHPESVCMVAEQVAPPGSAVWALHW